MNKETLETIRRPLISEEELRRIYNKAEVQKNLRQLSGARRQLFDLKTPIELENPFRGKEKFDPSIIKEIYLISVLLGEGEEMLSFFERL